VKRQAGVFRNDTVVELQAPTYFLFPSLQHVTHEPAFNPYRTNVENRVSS